MKMICLILSALFSSGCVTTHMWGIQKEEPKEEWVYKKDPDNWGFIQVQKNKPPKQQPLPAWKKVVFTPLTLSLDILLLSIDSFLDDPLRTKEKERKRKDKEKYYLHNSHIH